MEKMYLVPAKDLTVINPATNAPLPPEGAPVEPSTYWMRRLAEGDVTEGKPSKKVKE